MQAARAQQILEIIGYDRKRLNHRTLEEYDPAQRLDGATRDAIIQLRIDAETKKLKTSYDLLWLNCNVGPRSRRCNLRPKFRKTMRTKFLR